MKAEVRSKDGYGEGWTLEQNNKGDGNAIKV